MDYKEYFEDNNYLIYQDGRVFSKKTNKFLKGKVDNAGYQMYCLTIHSKPLGTYRKYVYAHHLVAQAFIPNPDNLEVVNHIDENRLNNHVENLEWVSHKENYKKYKNNNWDKRVSNRKETRYIEKNLLGEEWLDIKDHSLYQVSNMGRVRNKRTFKWLRQDEAHKYNTVCLIDDLHHKHNVIVHRLVYCTFNNDYDLDDFVVDHIDANSKNNKLSNLQKITQSQNCKKQKRYQK
jgi:hypothetical protein